MLAIEIPVYFPHKIGLDPNAILFIHNEFTIQFFYDRAPLYIMALYPALMYSCYVLVDEMGVFKQRWGTVIGAITVGFIHQGFYEIFDHFGTQYGWWIWNYTNFIGSVASVPLGSLFGFAFLGPVALTLAVRLVLAPYLQKQEARSKKAKKQKSKKATYKHSTVCRANYFGRRTYSAYSNLTHAH